MIKHKLLSLFVALIVATNIFASNIEVDGIWYDFDNTKLTASVTYKGSSARDFYNEYTDEVYIPSHVYYGKKIYTVTAIGDGAFEGCGTLTHVSFMSYSITTIGDDAFYGCSSLTSVIIGDSVKTIGSYAFYKCTGLTSVTIPNSVTTIGNSAFKYCSSLTSVVIPSSVTTIGDYDFYGCTSLTSVTIPNSVTTIGDDAFRGCSGLTSVTIPNSVTKIGDDAFYGCSRLTSINVDAANTHYCSVDGVLFNYTKDTLIQYPADNARTTYIIPNSVTTIGDDAFRGCSGLTSVTIPNSVTTIGWYAFYDCSDLKTVTIGNSVTTIGDVAFYGCSGLTSVTIPNSVTTIGKSAFSECSGLISVSIPNSITTIENFTFNNCSGLTSVTIPNSVTTIGIYAFDNCSGLRSITCYATNPPTASESIFSDVSQYTKAYVLASSLEDYQFAIGWRNLNLLPISSTETPVTKDDVTVVPTDNQATFTWPVNPSADGYTLEITKDGVVFCTLKFNAQGQLTGIAFAPSRDGARELASATMTANGWQFTVTGLNQGSKYGYTLDALNASKQSIKHYQGEFVTDGYTGPDELTIDNAQCTMKKFIRNNQLLILHNGKMYNALGF